MRFLQSYCVLDHEFRLLWVGGDWDEFALSNQGKSCLADQILSTPIQSHICDDDTSEAVSRMVRAVRDHQRELRIDYRCDSPTTMRRFQMTIQPMKDDRVLMVHDLRDARAFEWPLGPWSADRKAAACKCSFCCAVRQADATWAPPESLMGRHPEKVRYALCPECQRMIQAAVEQVETGQKPAEPLTGGFGP